MPVFGIVPYRTEARTRSEARTQEAVDFMLLILRTVNNVIRTAEGRLIELFRPPPVLLPPILRPDGLPDPHRAYNRSMRISLLRPLWGIAQQADGSYRWDEDYEEDRTTYHNLSWGTLQ